MVGEEGLEPSRLSAPAPKAGVYTNFTTRPSFDLYVLMYPNRTEYIRLLTLLA